MVILCVSASSEGIGPKPHLASSLSVTKEWNSLSACRRALWIRSRWNLLREGRQTTVKEQAKVRRRTYPQDEGFLGPQYNDQMCPDQRP